MPKNKGECALMVCRIMQGRPTGPSITCSLCARTWPPPCWFLDTPTGTRHGRKSSWPAALEGELLSRQPDAAAASAARSAAGKGGKNRRRGKNDSDDKRELIFKEDG